MQVPARSRSRSRASRPAYGHTCPRIVVAAGFARRLLTTTALIRLADHDIQAVERYTLPATAACLPRGPMVIEVNTNPALNAIASLMLAAGVCEHLTGAIIGA